MLALKHADYIRASTDIDRGVSTDFDREPAPMFHASGLPTVDETTREEGTMQPHTIKRSHGKGPFGAAAAWVAAVTAAAAIAACGATGESAAAPTAFSSTATTLTYYAFDINNATTDPGFIPVPGTDPHAFAQGDELIINDQLTTTHKVNGGYPIVGHDGGVCTLTRIPEPHARQTLANCVVTAVWRNGGSLTLQGVVSFRAKQPEPAALAITGGTGRFNGAAGTVGVSFTSNFKILTIKLK
jgi:ABC-type transport system substrate-binding protein